MEKDELQRRNNELVVNLGGNANNEGAKIRARIDDPSYGIDYMLEVLKCLKTLDSKPGMIRTTVYNQELVLEIATKVCPVFSLHHFKLSLLIASFVVYFDR